MSYKWEAWIGQRITDCVTEDNGKTLIVLEDGRGATFRATGHFFTIPAAAKYSYYLSSGNFP